MNLIFFLTFGLSLLSSLVLGSFQNILQDQVELSDSNLGTLRDELDQYQDLLIYFYSKQCAYCARFEQYFQDVINADGIAPGTKIYRVNVDSNPQLSLRFFITRIPSLFHVVAGNIYNINQHKIHLAEYFDQKTWRTLKPIRSFMAPFGPLGKLFGFWGQLIKLGLDFGEKYSINAWQWALIFVITVSILLAAAALIGTLFRPLYFKFAKPGEAAEIKKLENLSDTSDLEEDALITDSLKED